MKYIIYRNEIYMNKTKNFLLKKKNYDENKKQNFKFFLKNKFY